MQTPGPTPTPPPFDGIELSPTRVICSRHGEVFRAHWPQGYAVFALQAFEHVVKQEGFAAYADGKIGAAQALLDERPLCCRLSPETLLQVYVACGVGRSSRCAHCREVAAGTPYRCSLPENRVEAFAHLCFRCIVLRTRAIP